MRYPGCKVRCLRFLYPEHGYFQQKQLDLCSIEVYPPFTSCELKQAGAKGVGYPVILSQGEILWVPQGGDLRFRRTDAVFSARVSEGSLPIFPM